jgi:hypothetical protein
MTYRKSTGTREEAGTGLTYWHLSATDDPTTENRFIRIPAVGPANMRLYLWFLRDSAHACT